MPLEGLEVLNAAESHKSSAPGSYNLSKQKVSLHSLPKFYFVAGSKLDKYQMLTTTFLFS